DAQKARRTPRRQHRHHSPPQYPGTDRLPEIGLLCRPSRAWPLSCRWIQKITRQLCQLQMVLVDHLQLSLQGFTIAHQECAQFWKSLDHAQQTNDVLALLYLQPSPCADVRRLADIIPRSHSTPHRVGWSDSG